jgi:CBS domain containing-hemolysin-like protein
MIKKPVLILMGLGLLTTPLVANASFLPPDLIDDFANIISWIVLVTVPVGLIAAFWYVHILPDTVAKRRKHPQRDAIHTLCLLSLLFGGLLWPFAYLWAYTRPTMYKLAYGTDQYEAIKEDATVEQSAEAK